MIGRCWEHKDKEDCREAPKYSQIISTAQSGGIILHYVTMKAIQ